MDKLDKEISILWKDMPTISSAMETLLSQNTSALLGNVMADTMKSKIFYNTNKYNSSSLSQILELKAFSKYNLYKNFEYDNWNWKTFISKKILPENVYLMLFTTNPEIKETLSTISKSMFLSDIFKRNEPFENFEIFIKQKLNTSVLENNIDKDQYEKVFFEFVNMPETKEILATSNIINSQSLSHSCCDSFNNLELAQRNFYTSFKSWWASLEKWATKNPIRSAFLITIIGFILNSFGDNIAKEWSASLNTSEELTHASELVELYSLSMPELRKCKVRITDKDTFFTLISGKVLILPQKTVIVEIGSEGKYIVATALINGSFEEGRCLKKYTHKIDIERNIEK